MNTVQEVGGFWRIRAIAFVCGAAVMGLEMAGVRLLEPYLGSTIYVWGAIIGIFLGALALGYFLGGRLADRCPSMRALGLVILLAAFWILAIPLTAVYIGSSIADSVQDPRLAAFLASLILYAAPSVLLGMVSPFAVRLSAREVASMGNVAGSLYAISTFGSIFGTFLVTFALTEWLGTMTITWGVAGVLLLTAALCLPRKNHNSLSVGLSLVAIGLCAAGWFGSQRADLLRRQSSVGLGVEQSQIEGGINLAMRESTYHLINVFDSSYNLDTQRLLSTAQRARYMMFNNQIESGCLLAADGKEPRQPIESACGYVRLLSLGTLVSGKAPSRIAVIGAGGGVGAALLRQDYADSVTRVDVVDIDRMVFEMAGRYFGYPYPDSDGVMQSHVRDGRLFIRNAPERWDYIVLDAYTAGGRIPRHLITREFFEQAAAKLDTGGVVVCNIISAVEGRDGRLLRAVCRTMEQVFQQVYVFPRNANPLVPGNVIVVATNDSGPHLNRLELLNRFNKLQGSLIRQPVQYAVVHALNQSPADANDPVLTDDFCPTDSMVRGAM